MTTTHISLHAVDGESTVGGPGTGLEGPGPLSPGLYGPQGWTTRTPLWYLLSAFCAPRASGSGEGAPLGGLIEEGRPRVDYVPFAGLSSDAALSLLEWLPSAALEDRQNSAPTLRSLLRACATGGDVLLLCGYGIGPQRSDERVSVEALWVREDALAHYRVVPQHDEGCQCESLWEEVSSRYRLDAEAVPDEILRTAPSWGGGDTGWWFWWD